MGSLQDKGELILSLIRLISVHIVSRGLLDTGSNYWNCSGGNMGKYTSYTMLQCYNTLGSISERVIFEGE